MKIKPEHVAHIREAIAGIDTDARRELYKTGQFPRASHCNDLDMRYRWDLTYEAGLSRYFCDNVYSYADDSHIDTALRSIVSAL